MRQVEEVKWRGWMEKQGKDGGERWEQSREKEKTRIFRVKK